MWLKYKASSKYFECKKYLMLPLVNGSLKYNRQIN